jgi:hypothetical protein
MLGMPLLSSIPKLVLIFTMNTWIQAVLVRPHDPLELLRVAYPSGFECRKQGGW